MSDWFIGRSEIITVLGGGWSARSADLSKLPGTVIGVNDAAIYARCDIAVSMDRLWTEGRWPDLTGIAKPAYIRTAALKNIPSPRPDWLMPFDCDHKASHFVKCPGWLNGLNSGQCALNLAWLMQPRELFMLGFDMNRSPKGDPYWFKPYPWAPGGATKPGKYVNWAKEFENAKACFDIIGTKVFNVSPTSAIDAFPKMSFEDFRKVQP